MFRVISRKAIPAAKPVLTCSQISVGISLRTRECTTSGANRKAIAQ